VVAQVNQSRSFSVCIVRSALPLEHLRFLSSSDALTTGLERTYGKAKIRYQGALDKATCKMTVISAPPRARGRRAKPI
jgi:hypothetical protein